MIPVWVGSCWGPYLSLLYIRSFVQSGNLDLSIISEQGKLQKHVYRCSRVAEAIELAHFASSPGRLFAR